MSNRFPIIFNLLCATIITTIILLIRAGNVPYYKGINCHIISVTFELYLNCCDFSPEDQLNHCRIEVSKYPNVFNTFADIRTALEPGESKRFSQNPGVTGSILRIRNVDKARRALTLCEVKVYVKETGIILVI